MVLCSGGFSRGEGGGGGGVCKWAVSNVFSVHINKFCTSPSNDYIAVACSNNNQAQVHTHVSVPYRSPEV